MLTCLDGYVVYVGSTAEGLGGQILTLVGKTGSRLGHNAYITISHMVLGPVLIQPIVFSGVMELVQNAKNNTLS